MLFFRLMALLLLLAPLSVWAAPVLYLQLDSADADGVVLDSSGANNHGKVGQALLTDDTPAHAGGVGTCGYVALENSNSVEVKHHGSLNFNTAISVSLWIRPSVEPRSAAVLLEKGDNYRLMLNSDRRLVLTARLSGFLQNETLEVTSTKQIPLNEWTHVGFSLELKAAFLIRDYIVGRFYLNGTPAGEGETRGRFLGSTMTNAESLFIGGGSSGFVGAIDEVRIDSALLQTGQFAAHRDAKHACTVSLSCISDDFDARNELGRNWAVTHRSGGFGSPRIVGKRLRLTDDTDNVSTAATFQRLFPSRNNLITVEFAYNAYSNKPSRGADGIAVILSDGSVTPQPGAFGGSLGYAQKTGISGFAGGWLGIGLDEYGNYSTSGEGRIGGAREGISDAIAIRGASTTGYDYLEGTGTLQTGIDVSRASPTAGPNHRYRITIDSRESGRTLVSVGRDTSGGTNYSALLERVDVHSKQPALPEDFWLSFTGSTGSQVNIHEIDDLRVCAHRMKEVGTLIDHFRIEAAATALTCNPLPVTLLACLDSDCRQRFVDNASATMQLVNASGQADIDTRALISGSGSFELRSTSPGLATLSVVSSTPPARAYSATLCHIGGRLSSDCRVNFADSGFLLDVPNMIAGKTVEASLQAVRKDDKTQACVPGFAKGQRNVAFRAVYSDPATGTRPVLINETEVSTKPATVGLRFDDDARATLDVRYDDAGLMAAEVRLLGEGKEAELSMTGSDDFVSKPYGLCLETPANCVAAGTDDNCRPFAHAGDSFEIAVKAVAWQFDGEPLTAEALCTGNTVTPNFALSGIQLASTIVAPADGESGTLKVTQYEHQLGEKTVIVEQTQSEVGVFRLTATPTTSFHGETVSGGVSSLVGRFIPAYLGATGNASLRPSCGSFSYQGQPIALADGKEPLITVTAYNRDGQITRNYDRGAFWRLAAPSEGSYRSVAGLPSDERLILEGTSQRVEKGAEDGDGARSYQWQGNEFRYVMPVKVQQADLPYMARLVHEFTSNVLTDEDGVCIDKNGQCQDFGYAFADEPGTEVRLGRLRLDNAHGSEHKELTLPLVIESLQVPGSFQLEGLDNCTAPMLATPELSEHNGGLSSASYGDDKVALIAPNAGSGALLLQAPNVAGSVVGSLEAVPDWLLFDWRGQGAEKPRGLATFGIYKGPKPLIFRRELYR